jgi:hypothetical protein
MLRGAALTPRRRPQETQESRWDAPPEGFTVCGAVAEDQTSDAAGGAEDEDEEEAGGGELPAGWAALRTEEGVT